MKRALVAWVAAAVLVAGGAGLAYVFWFAGGSGEPSTDLTTPGLSEPTTTPLSGSTTADPSTSTTDITSTRSFVIVQERSTARFEIDEVLNGSPKHVVGRTNQVAGQFRFDPVEPSTMELSEIVVNARTLRTDSERRDRAMRGPVILDSGSDDHELVTFVATAVQGLVDPISPGETIEFTIAGDLTIKGTTRSVSFDVSAEMVDADTIEGSAFATIERDAFGIGIPSVPNVADVSNEVLIGLEFVAVAG